MADAKKIKKMVKKKVSKRDEKAIKDYEEREKAEKGYDEDARRYGMNESVYAARPKTKQDVEVKGRTDGKTITYTYDHRGENLGQSTPAHREFMRIRVGDTKLKTKEAEVRSRLSKPLKEEIAQILESKKKGSGTPEVKSDPCWSGYRQYGMKMKNGKSVPNCVKEK